MPGVADWKRLHRPYLEKARALIVVCTPGAYIDEGDEDWVHREIDWWITHREQAPILIDPLMEGSRFVPPQIAVKWPDIQRISLVETEWAKLDGAQLEQKTEALRRQVVGAILPSGAAIYEEELERERAQAAAERDAKQKARSMLKVSLGLLAGVVGLGAFAAYSAVQSQKNERIAQARRLDAEAGEQFQLVRRLVGQRAAAQERRSDLLEQLRAEQPAQLPAPALANEALATGGEPAEPDAPTTGSPPEPSSESAATPGAAVARSPEQTRYRVENLRSEIGQAETEITDLSKRAAEARKRGQALLVKGDSKWEEIARRDGAEIAAGRLRPQLPEVFSVEILSAGYGESILLHYGPMDQPRLILINTGPRSGYRRTLEPRLRELSERNFNGGPVPIELIAIGDQDEEKTGGLKNLLDDVAEAGAAKAAPARPKLIWANIFRYDGGAPTFRNSVRDRIDGLGIPLNKPFGRIVARPARGRLLHDLGGGMKVMVLGPTRRELKRLHELVRKTAEGRGGIIEPFPARDPAESSDGIRLRPSPASFVPEGTRCKPSRRARELAGGGYTDGSAPNLASTILLFQFGGRTFLHTGDSRGDLIIAGLAASGLLDSDGRAFVDLMNIPHFGSRHNVRPDFFGRIRAGSYLVTGDGRFNNPAIEVLAGLISARQCESFRMIFTTRDYRERPRRDGPGDPRQTDPYFAADRAHPGRVAESLTMDAFFSAEQANRPNYQREFLSPRRGSIFVDLLEPLP